MKKTFIWALEKMKSGIDVKRIQWENGNASNVKLNRSGDGFVLKMKGGASIPWSPSNADIFADDWEETGV